MERVTKLDCGCKIIIKGGGLGNRIDFCLSDWKIYKDSTSLPDKYLSVIKKRK